MMHDSFTAEAYEQVEGQQTDEDGYCCVFWGHASTAWTTNVCATAFAM
jgi:hypothetical protein